MKKYSKEKLKFRRVITVLLGMVFTLVLIFGIVILNVSLRDRFDVYKEVNDAFNVSDDIAQNSTPIIVDNLVVGATYKNKWVSANKYYLKSTLKTDTEMCAYTKAGKAGTFKIRQVESVNDSIYANTTYGNYMDEYFAIVSDNTNYALGLFSEKTEILEMDYNSVKGALGYYNIYNSSVKINAVYDGYINANCPVRIICAVSAQRGTFGGVYSTIIIAPLGGTPKILSYSYLKDLNNTEEFPIYNFEFLADLNGDGNFEIVCREITEFNINYSVYEQRNNEYYRVLSETIKGK